MRWHTLSSTKVSGCYRNMPLTLTSPKSPNVAGGAGEMEVVKEEARSNWKTVKSTNVVTGNTS